METVINKIVETVKNIKSKSNILVTSAGFRQSKQIAQQLASSDYKLRKSTEYWKLEHENCDIYFTPVGDGSHFRGMNYSHAFIMDDAMHSEIKNNLIKSLNSRDCAIFISSDNA